MSDAVRELLPLYALGILEPDEARTVERAIARDPALAAELATYQVATQDLVVAVTPSSEVKARLFASITGGRYEKYATRLASLFAVTVERAREIIGLTERSASWELQMPGIELVHFAGGPMYAEADCGFIRLAAGTVFPPHKHLGEEVSLILSGQLLDQVTGIIYGPGDELVLPLDSDHDVKAIGDEPCIYAARAMNGISVGGVPQRPHR